MNIYQWIAVIGAADLAVTLVFVLFFRGADERRDEPPQPILQPETQQ
ncbi:hypothetical protein J2801_003618 [Paraburkholderia phenoliruptrix]|nr:hypothetical protein [Paraburkholderia phenoliruptrix]MDR6421330.1 hypothetical protein [Paraburkholderia phenoliruptrix]